MTPAAVPVLVLLAALLLASAFFSGAEIALTRLSKIKVKHWIHTGGPNSEAWANWLSRPQELITAILAGNTLTNIFFSSTAALLAVHLFARHNRAWVEALSGALSFVLLLVFGEIVPKIYARQNPERVASAALGPLFKVSQLLGKPVDGIMRFLGRWLPLLKEPPPGRISVLTLDEIRAIVLDKTSLQGLDREHQEMMGRVLQLHRTTVSQIMTPWDRVEVLSIDEARAGGPKLERFIDRWVESGRTRLPVVDPQASRAGEPPPVIGYLYVKDLLSCVAQEKLITPAQCQRWARKLPSLLPDKKIADVLDIFRFGSPIACVRDPLGFPLGIVTLEDILEEFVGEILDEYDLEER